MRTLIFAAACAAGFAAPAGAVSYTSSPFDTPPPPPGSVAIDFEGATPSGFTLTGGTVVQGSNDDMASPAGNVTKYLTTGTGSASLTSVTGYNQISFYWGSIDSYNTLEILGFGGSLLASFSGGSVWTPANGDRTSADTNRRFVFSRDSGDGAMHGLRFVSSQNAFEVDNVAFAAAAVPEVETWALMMLGFGLLGFRLRQTAGRAPRRVLS